MVMLPALAPTFFIAATPLAGDRQLPIPIVIEPAPRAPEGVLRRGEAPARVVAPEPLAD
jgi:hypothetical protein